jgi:opacity protein-like surface antigen
MMGKMTALLCLLCALGLGKALAADPYATPTAYAAPAAQPAVKQYPGYYFDRRTWRYYPIPKATASPSPAPTTAPTASGTPVHVSTSPFSDYRFPLALHGGYSMPSGELADREQPLPFFSLEGQAKTQERLSLALAYSYTAFSYKPDLAAAGATQPDTLNGLTFKGLYDIVERDDWCLYLGLGASVYMINSAIQTSVKGDGSPIMTYTNDTGFGLCAGGGVEYPFMPHLAAVVDVWYNGISVDGGTGAQRIFGQFSVGAKYTF